MSEEGREQGRDQDPGGAARADGPAGAGGSEVGGLEVGRVLTLQLVIGALAALLAWGLVGVSAVPSALAGLVICVLPSMSYAIRTTRVRKDRRPDQILRTFFAAELFKLLMTAVLFVLSFLLIDISPLVLFLTYIGCLSAYWFSLLIPHRGF
ncbi:MAG: ATP synthase subunit I [Gammaproteobacteria bacterium]|nr:ATP synthase subunit I [Gammaproteobacteria bacterium]